jgi:hypothetical protein
VTPGQIVGLALVLTGLLDLVLGLAVVGRRIQEGRQRRIVQLALVTGAVALLGLGTAFLAGALGDRAPAP